MQPSGFCPSGCDPDPAGEAVNQMHWALLSGAGAEDGGFRQQTASPAWTGDALSGPFFCLLSYPTYTLIHTLFNIPAAFKAWCHLSAWVQQWRQLTLHLLCLPLSHTHTHRTSQAHTYTHHHISPERLQDHGRTILIFLLTHWRRGALSSLEDWLCVTALLTWLVESAKKHVFHKLAKLKLSHKVYQIIFYIVLLHFKMFNHRHHCTTHQATTPANKMWLWIWNLL